MKKLLLVILVVVSAISSSEAEKIKGKIIFQDDTVDVTFNIPVNLLTQTPNYEKLQYRVKYFDKNGRKKKLKPDQAKEIQFRYNNENVRMLSMVNTVGGGSNMFSFNPNIFLKLEVDGELKMYSHYVTQHTPGMYNATTGMSPGYTYSFDRYLLQKGDSELKKPKALGFRKDMMEYFSDCPTLVQQIDNKAFKKADLEAIVIFYNSQCK